jgi:hypothetical protein
VLAILLPLAVIFEAPLTAAAIAGAAVSVPIIIHLLNRKRFKVVHWAAMRFLLAAQRKNSRRMRLEQLILLLVRCTLVALLVLAMASITPWAEAMWRWFAPEAAVSHIRGSQKTYKVLVLDGSYGMDVKLGAGEQSAFQRARTLAAQIVRGSSRGDAFSVVLMAAPPRRIVPEPSEDGSKVALEIENLKLPHGNADLPATLTTVESLLGDSPVKFAEKEVYFLTNLQKATWTSTLPVVLTPALKRARSVIVDVGPQETANVAVTGLRVVDDIVIAGRETVIEATVQNFGTEVREKVKVKLLVGQAGLAGGEGAFELQAERNDKSTKEIERLPRGAEHAIRFIYKFDKPGDYAIQVQIANDALALDDARSAVITVKKDLPVLLVNGKSFGDPLDQSAEWLRLALNPNSGTKDENLFVARPHVINTSHFADEDTGNLVNYDCVFLCDVPAVNLAERRRLENHLRRGGGVVFCLGDQVQAGEYNSMLFRDGVGLLPAGLVGFQDATKVHQYRFALESDSEKTAPLRAFQGADDQASLLAAQFRRFYELKLPAGVKPRRVLSFVSAVIPGKEKEATGKEPPPGGPAILEWHPPAPEEAGQANKPREQQGPRLRGRVVLINTTANSEWNTWPASPSYPALMQELLTFASAGRLQERAVEVGQTLELFLPVAGGSDALVEIPGGRKEKVRTQELDDASVLRWIDTDVSGIYRVAAGKREHLFAVNVPALNNARLSSPSDLTRTNREELQKVYPEWDLQLVTEPGQVVRTTSTADGTEIKIYEPLGPTVARWLLLVVLGIVLIEVVLAFVFGHYSSTATTLEDAAPKALGWKEGVLLAMPWLLLVFGLAVGFVLVHNYYTGDLLGFLPEGMRRTAEGWLDIPPPAEGEGSRWRLDYTSFFWDSQTDPWLAGSLLVLATAGIILIYRREGHKPSPGYRVLMVGMRVGLLLLLLVVLLPRLELYFERQGWPDVVILIDDSQSMSATERYNDDATREAANTLAKEAARLAKDKTVLAARKEEQAQVKEDSALLRSTEDPERIRLTQEADLLREQARALRQDAGALERAKDGADLQRLHLLEALTTRDDMKWLNHLLKERKVKVHIYHCSSRAARLASVTSADQLAEAADSIHGLVASPRNDSSQLGDAIRQVLGDFRGSSLSAVIMLTDGVTTEGDDVVKASKYASRLGVPLYFVGAGDAHEIRDIFLHKLQAPDSAYVKDKVVFSLSLTGQGYKNMTVPVTLREKGKAEVLDKQMVQLDGTSKEIKVRLTTQPKEAGEKVYVIDTPVQEDEVEKDNNHLEHQLTVIENQKIRVLYVEGYRRYEYHFLKTLLERESARVKGNKSIDLKVLLLDADEGYVKADRSAISAFPIKSELMDNFDVVILGDVDPSPQNDPKMKEHLQDLADFVSKRGGGLLMIAGERYAPQLYKDTPLKDILPIDITAVKPEEEADLPREEGYKPELTPAGRVHPIFLFGNDEKDTEEIWTRLQPLYWWAEGFQPKRAAEVLLVHPRVKRGDKGKDSGGSDRHPLVIQQFVGAGRSMFFGINETWRWGHREDQAQYNKFWIQTVRYLARSRLGRIDLKLDKQTPYNRGDPIKVTVRFPDDRQPPPEDVVVKVVVERRPLGKKNAEPEARTTLTLARAGESRTTFEKIHDQTPQGEYTFWLSQADKDVPNPKPRAECKVLAPPGEMYGLRMNQSDMETAAEETRGKFYTLATADNVLDELHVGARVTLNASGPPWAVWNHVVFFLAALLFLSTEWLLRKRKNLL